MRSKRETTFRFWIISALGYAAVLTGLFLTPAGQRIMQREERAAKPEILRKDEALAEVIDDIRDLAVDRLKSQVLLLEAGRERMAVNFDTLNRHHQPFVAGQIASARARLQQEGEKTLALQEEIRQAARLALEQKETAGETLGKIYDRTRAALVAGMEEIRRVARLLAPDDRELISRQSLAEETQMKVFEQLSADLSEWNQIRAATLRLQTLAKHQASLERELAGIATETGELRTKIERLKKAESDGQAAKQAEEELAALKQREANRQASLAQTLENAGQAAKTLAEEAAKQDAKVTMIFDLQEKAAAHQREVYSRLIARLDRQAAEPSPAKPGEPEPAP